MTFVNKSFISGLFFFQYVVRFFILKFDSKKGTPEATLPVPEPSDLDHCCYIDFEKERAECNKLKSELEKIE